jgi:predicted nucleic acid-binding protein
MNEPKNPAILGLLGKVKQEPVTIQAEPVFWPEVIYFDTNSLLRAGWPSPSAQLLQVMNEADKLGFPLCLPEAVNQELEGHWIRELIKEWQEASGRVERCNKKAHRLVKFNKLPGLPSKDDLRKAVQELAIDFTGRFRIVPLTQRPLSEFLTLAISRGAMFEDEGKGFQDSVILCSVLDDMKAKGFKVGALVTHDSDFSLVGAIKLVRDTGVELKVVATLDELEKLLRRCFNSVVLEHMDQERKQLIDALEAQQEEIENYLIENLTFTASELGLWKNIKRVESLFVASIENAHTAIDLNPEQKLKDPNKVKISADVKVHLTLDIERYPTTPQEKLKVGGRSVPPSAPLSPLASVLFEQMAKVHEAVAVVEAEATKTETGYSDIHFTAAYLKQPGMGFGGFGALVGGSQ